MNNQDNMVYNDCFYTAMEQNYDFVAIMDPDEACTFANIQINSQGKQR